MKKQKSGKKSCIVSAMFKISFFKCSLHFFFLVGFVFLSTFSFLVKFNYSKKSAITLNLVKWTSAYFWQIKTEFVITGIPILWVPASVDFRKFMMQMYLCPSAHPLLCSLSTLTFQINFWKHQMSI